MTPKQRLRFITWALYLNGTFVLMSTGGLNQRDVSLCILNQIFYHTFPYVGRAHGRGRGGPASLHVGLFILSVKGTDGGWGRGRGRDQAQGGDLEARQLGTGKRFVAFTQPALILHCRWENLCLYYPIVNCIYVKGGRGV